MKIAISGKGGVGKTLLASKSSVITTHEFDKALDKLYHLPENINLKEV